MEEDLKIGMDKAAKLIKSVFIEMIYQGTVDAEDAMIRESLTPSELHTLKGVILGMNLSIEIIKRGSARSMIEYLLNNIRY